MCPDDRVEDVHLATELEYIWGGRAGQTRCSNAFRSDIPRVIEADLA